VPLLLDLLLVLLALLDQEQVLLFVVLKDAHQIVRVLERQVVLVVAVLQHFLQLFVDAQVFNYVGLALAVAVRFLLVF
jgi:hypothetical protein